MSGRDRRTIVIAAIVVIVAFLAGIMVGVASDRLLRHRNFARRPMMWAMMVHRLDRHLDLTDAQQKQVQQILARRHERLEGQMRVEIDATNAEIERVLTAEQREKFRKMRMRLGPLHGRQRHERHEGKGRTESTR